MSCEKAMYSIRDSERVIQIRRCEAGRDGSTTPTVRAGNADALKDGYSVPSPDYVASNANKIMIDKPNGCGLREDWRVRALALDEKSIFTFDLLPSYSDDFSSFKYAGPFALSIAKVVLTPLAYQNRMIHRNPDPKNCLWHLPLNIIRLSKAAILHHLYPDCQGKHRYLARSELPKFLV
ncbi:hypothetical protein BT96DRAFT_1023441 [Gymnopus androsaceus JB14]|uniref:Uncharacterized protein n=1 Tax=Gymnopus androsaceus JB14 TaxID=1447944 RepID=A0A6A4H4Q8_9AGAR|nr:hypothetical protein BT96DRAFT_1023441 [Gymnopus androsaceus JB14]